jgi:putative oxidoreductase
VTPPSGAAAAAPAPRPGKALNVLLWIAQFWIGLSFLFGGGFRAIGPWAMMSEKIPWVPSLPEWLVRGIGAAEVLGALGVLLPSLTRIKPKLTPLAAALLALVMVLAIGFYVSRGEAMLIAPNVLLGGLAAFVAWGRWKRAPIAPR